jgi:hypothetical protein
MRADQPSERLIAPCHASPSILSCGCERWQRFVIKLVHDNFELRVISHGLSLCCHLCMFVGNEAQTKLQSQLKSSDAPKRLKLPAWVAKLRSSRRNYSDSQGVAYENSIHRCLCSVTFCDLQRVILFTMQGNDNVSSRRRNVLHTRRAHPGYVPWLAACAFSIIFPQADWPLFGDRSVLCMLPKRTV